MTNRIEHQASVQMERPLLSIVIPTCNRHQYLLSVLRTLLIETQAQLVVSDNSDEALPHETLLALKAGTRLIYRHHVDQLSVVENFERGQCMSTGEYLLFLGDDDCVGPGVEDVVRWAHAQGIDAVVSYQRRFIANYFWPGVKSKYFDGGYAGKLFLNRYDGRVRALDGCLETFKASRNPGTGLGGMPRAYHGLVSRDLVARVLAKYGRLFGGVSPDIFSATLIAKEARHAVAVDFPFVIPGGSAPSTAGEGAARADVDRLDARDHIKRFGTDLVWDPRIPAFYSPITVWAYSQQMGLNALGPSGYDINYPRLYLKCLLIYRQHRGSTFAAMRHWLHGRSAVGLWLRMAPNLAAETAQFASRVWFRFIFRPRVWSELEDIGAAFSALKGEVEPWQPPIAPVRSLKSCP